MPSDEKKELDAAIDAPRDAVGGEQLPHETHGETTAAPLDEPVVPGADEPGEAPAAEVISDEATKSDDGGSVEGPAGEAGPADADLDAGAAGDVGSAEDAGSVEPAGSAEAPSAELVEGQADGGASGGDDGLSDAGTADSGAGGDAGVADDAADSSAAGADSAGADEPVGDSSGEPAADPEPAPAEPVEPASEEPAEPSTPAPKLGSVRGEVDQIQQLPDAALDALRDGGIALFLFLARLERADDGLQGEAKARLSAVKTATVQLLAAVERVFIREG